MGPVPRRRDGRELLREPPLLRSELDAAGGTIWDHSGAGGSADVDAVAVLQHTGNQAADGPICDLWIDANDRLNVVFEDPDGVSDIVDVTTTVSMIPISFFAILHEFLFVEATDTRVHLLLAQPIAGTGWLADLTVSVADTNGTRSSDQVTIQG